jgi:hypothetical protein
MIVCVENQDGNTNVKTDQPELLTRCFKLLKNNKIYIKRARMDAGSYYEDVIEVVRKNCKFFYIRANRSEAIRRRISQITD